jgi:glutathione peroxidase
MNKLFYLSILLVFTACFNEVRHRPEAKIVKADVSSVSNNTQSIMAADKFYTFKVRSLDGVEVNLEQFKGKKIVVLNTASACGFTPQYADWETFYEANKDKIVVLGFPCNQFGGQESGTHAEIKSFCQKNYGVTFPMFEKIDVKGDNQAPIYKWLSDKSQNGWCDKVPTWNFCKYLVNEKGELVEFFASNIKPDNAEFLAAIKK